MLNNGKRFFVLFFPIILSTIGCNTEHTGELVTSAKEKTDSFGIYKWYYYSQIYDNKIYALSQFGKKHNAVELRVKPELVYKSADTFYLYMRLLDDEGNPYEAEQHQLYLFINDTLKNQIDHYLVMDFNVDSFFLAKEKLFISYLDTFSGKLDPWLQENKEIYINKKEYPIHKNW